MMFLIAVGLVGALAQSAPAPSGATVSGRVVEDGSRASIEGAQVMLVPSRPRARTAPVPFERPRTTVTDRDGRYTFDQVEAGRYHVSVQKAGFAALNGSGSPEVALAAGERRMDVNLSLQKGAVITGRVLDDAGQPMVNTQVMVLQKPPDPAAGVTPRRFFLMPGGASAQTNDLGEFRLFGLSPGEYYVQATRHDFGGPSTGGATTLLPTYFPSASDVVAAQPISVGAGQTFGEVEIRMVAAPAFQVSGVVTDESGKPLANAMVTLRVDDPSRGPMFMMGDRNQSRTDAAGKFTLTGVTDGAYTLLAVAGRVTSGPRGRGAAVAAAGSGGISFGFGSSDFVGGTTGGGVTTETGNGTTVEYPGEDTGTRVPVTVNHASVSGLQVVVRRPAP